MPKETRVVLAAGTFDLLHPGHLAYLEACKAQGDLLVVCIAGDRRVRERKGAGRPIVNAHVRARLVAALKPVDAVFVSNAKPFTEPILRAVRPQVIVTTEDEPSAVQKAKFVREFRHRHPEIRLHLMERAASPLGSFSTTRLLARLRRQHAARKP